MQVRSGGGEGRPRAEAEVVLRKKGIVVGRQESPRSTKQGVIASYIHPGSQLGVMIEVNCESDFVKRTDEFQGTGA